MSDHKREFMTYNRRIIMADNKNNANAINKSSIGVIGAELTIIFFVLKITHIIDWSWWWVFSPVIAIMILWLTGVLILCVLYLKDN
jgi:hypothetical protein